LKLCSFFGIVSFTTPKLQGFRPYFHNKSC
jgi:hypothetical protein